MTHDTNLAEAVRAIRAALYRPLTTTERDFFAKHLATLLTRIDAAIVREVAAILETD